jgi:phosphoribosylformimino-5-aminoimidazole carboxamide ribonucleotide (ProFAR) isomerase
LASLGVRALLVTDVARDGAMEGPNLDLLAAVRAAFGGEILASGGLRGARDLGPVDAALAGGPRGAIFGRALHARATTVAALRAARDGVAA